MSKAVLRVVWVWLLAAQFLAPEAMAQSPGTDTGTGAGQDTSHTVVTRELFKSRNTSISAYPYVYYTPETELAFGAGGIVTFYTSEEGILRPSKVTLSGYYTTKEQYKFSLGPQLYFGRNSLFISTNLDYGYYVDKYWGTGNDSPEIDTEEYTSRAFGLDVNVQFTPIENMIGNTRVGIVYDLWNNDIEDKGENPYLLAGDVTGEDGGVSSGLGLNWIWDTRNDIFYPTGGGYSQVKAMFYGEDLGSDFDFNRFEIDVRQYISLRSKKIIAYQIFFNAVNGTTPFYELPALGGQRIMRGYYQGRYRDETLLASQVEYRSSLRGRLGYVAFAGIGDVADNLNGLSLKDMKASLGFGLRFKFSKTENVNLRADIGFGRDTNGVYFGLEEAF